MRRRSRPDPAPDGPSPDRAPRDGAHRIGALRTYVVLRYAGPPSFGYRPAGEVELDPLGTVEARTKPEARARAETRWPEVPARALRLQRAAETGTGRRLLALARDTGRAAGARRARAAARLTASRRGVRPGRSAPASAARVALTDRGGEQGRIAAPAAVDAHPAPALDERVYDTRPPEVRDVRRRLAPSRACGRPVGAR